MTDEQVTELQDKYKELLSETHCHLCPIALCKRLFYYLFCKVKAETAKK